MSFKMRRSKSYQTSEMTPSAPSIRSPVRSLVVYVTRTLACDQLAKTIQSYQTSEMTPSAPSIRSPVRSLVVYVTRTLACDQLAKTIQSQSASPTTSYIEKARAPVPDRESSSSRPRSRQLELPSQIETARAPVPGKAKARYSPSPTAKDLSLPLLPHLWDGRAIVSTCMRAFTASTPHHPRRVLTSTERALPREWPL